MRKFTLHSGKEHPMDCTITYLNTIILRVSRENFSIDTMLQLLGEHSAEQYSKEVIIPADYDFMEIEVREWELITNALILPVFVKDYEERRYVYRLDANTDILHKVMLYFNHTACLPSNAGFPIPVVDLENHLVFSNSDIILDTLYREIYPFIHTKIYMMKGSIGSFLVNESDEVNKSYDKRTGDFVRQHALKILRNEWNLNLSRDSVDIITEVTKIDDIIELQNGKYKSVPRTENCLSMIWQEHCFVNGKYTRTLCYRVEVYGVDGK